MQVIISLIKQFFFWMLVFAVSRTVFYVYYSGVLSIENIEFSEVFASFWYALPLDIATASYILVMPFLILTVQSYYTPKWLNYTSLVYTLIALFAYITVTTSEIGIYDEWKTKLQYKALNYISHPAEIYDSVATSTFFLLMLILVLQYVAGIWLYKRCVFVKIESAPRNIFFSILFVLIISGSLFLGVRGGTDEIPINQSKSYFSKHNFINLASVNSGYSFLISTMENYRFKDANPFEFYEPQAAAKRVQQLHLVQKDTTTYILKTNRPNIVLLLLESWSADLIQSLGGKEGITPEFRKLESEGILFTEFYTCGNRSQQAMSAILGGFPATPITAITHNLDKITRLPSLTMVLEEEGYSTSFYFGGELMYGGIKSFISVNGFDVIKEVSDFDDDLPRGKLGIHDEYILNEQFVDLSNKRQPFFSMLFTVSTHSPYDQPMEDVISWAANDNQNGYLNSAYYTDKCLGEYFEMARKQPWYSNTLFILVADHSHNTYKNWPVYTKEYRKIPLLLYGDVIKDKYKGHKINRIASQTDIAATLLAQLDIVTDDFFWSRNLFNPTTPGFAYFESTDGVGWITPSGYFVYNNTIDTYQEMQIEPQLKDSIIMDGKSYLQEVFRQLMEY
ncbi:MAG: sulfatase-like hydrolase/transferase [Bacteroidetes bacterium]|nr:sulfatase-like hydrolase/transferase [Bacteroidota bacterium]MBL6942812.1 sulfatase-like hydrolase/transferase [Bacteroidales bacterium]